MTIEQQIQQAIKDVFEAALIDSGLSRISVFAEKLDGPPTDEEQFPAIMILTSTPVPKSPGWAAVEVPVYIIAEVYLSRDPAEATARQDFAEMAEIIFRTIHQTEEWGDGPSISIEQIEIASSDQPFVSESVLRQETNCTAIGCIKTEVET
jgi:hypothetical protein